MSAEQIAQSAWAVGQLYDRLYYMGETPNLPQVARDLASLAYLVHELADLIAAAVPEERE